MAGGQCAGRHLSQRAPERTLCAGGGIQRQCQRPDGDADFAHPPALSAVVPSRARVHTSTGLAARTASRAAPPSCRRAPVSSCAPDPRHQRAVARGGTGAGTGVPGRCWALCWNAPSRWPTWPKNWAAPTRSWRRSRIRYRTICARPCVTSSASPTCSWRHGRQR
jgi:hypothetical protein